MLAACTTDLHGRFLPIFCPDFAPVACPSELGPAAEAAESKSGKGFQRKLEFPAWLMAWDGYSLAASVLGQVRVVLAHASCLAGIRLRVFQMSFSTAVKHKLVVSEIAADAAGQGRTALLGVLYDELAR